ncbi:B2 protein [Vigna unguiculata]|uniref:Cleavage and polyadenylation specificity factor subunit 4 n=2 Tax=Vigna unguiculata TaxID=3917 RepID=A0A4D6L9S6_VIGUN|nr:B2 protein [Vigna unguiculata]QCD85145.1 cleavage and polyadenylation specificity factor subunit 4 [Vigna unguiculata]
MENNQSFWQFSDQLRLQTSNLANLSLNDSIWSNSYVSKRRDERINFDIKVGGEINSFKSKEHASDYNDNLNGSFLAMTYNNNNNNNILGVGLDSGVGLNGGFNKGIYSKPSFANLNTNINLNINPKGHKGKLEDDLLHLPKSSKKNNNPNKKHDSNNSGTNNNDNGKDSKAAADKRFKTLPPSESLPRNETIGGYIFVCNNDTMAENLKRQLFGLPPRYRDSVRAITPGLPLFLYNYSTHQLHGIFEAAGFGGTNIDPTAWEDKKCPGESRFPAQVRVITRKTCEPLEEDSFRPILHHYDGPKFRLELNVPEALSLLDIFAEQDTFNETFKALDA